MVGGEPVAPESVPWFADVAGCGGMLVAPDRVLTAGHVQLDQSVTTVAPVALAAGGPSGEAWILGRGRQFAPGTGHSEEEILTDTPAAPVLLGVVSWGSTRCGADHTPSVFADVTRYRDFITGPSPTWAPSPTSAAKVTGSRKVGGTLRCTVDGYVARPTKVEVQWQRQGGRHPKNVGHARTYEVTRADAGHPLVCTLTASNDGGISTAAFAPTSMVKIPR